MNKLTLTIQQVKPEIGELKATQYFGVINRDEWIVKPNFVKVGDDFYKRIKNTQNWRLLCENKKEFRISVKLEL